MNFLTKTFLDTPHSISPVLAGFLLTMFDVRLLLVLNICTFFVIVGTTFIVRKEIGCKVVEKQGSFIAQMRNGLYAVTKKKGILLLVIMGR